MAGDLDLDSDDVIDACELMESIDWSKVPPPAPGTGAAVTADGRRLETKEEFDEWFNGVRTRRTAS